MQYSPQRSVYWLRDRRLVVRSRKYDWLAQGNPAVWRLRPDLRKLAWAELEDAIAAAPQNGLPAPKKPQQPKPALSERSACRVIRDMLAWYPEPVQALRFRFWVTSVQLHALEKAGLIELVRDADPYNFALWRVTIRGIEAFGGARRFLTREQSREESGFLQVLHEQGAILLEPYKGSYQRHEIRCADGHLSRVYPVVLSPAPFYLCTRC